MDRDSLWGLVPAAGRSTRMGRPKALLMCPDSDDTFVARVLWVLREGGIPNLVVALRPDDHPVRRAVERVRPPVAIVENRTPELGQLASVVAGLDHAEARGAEAVVVLPVDMPLVRPSSVTALVEAAVRHHALIARLVHHRRHGHPVLFRRAVFERLRAADPAVGARSVLHACLRDVVDVPVDDPGVLRDIDRPEEYQQLIDARRGGGRL